MIPENLYLLLDKMLPLLGVVIGACLTPLVGEHLEKRRRRKSIQIQLISTVGQFYNCWIAAMGEANYHGFYNKIQSLMWFAIQEEIAAGMIDSFRDRQLATYTEREHKHGKSLEAYYDTLTSLETNIKSLLWEYRRLWGKAKYEKIRSILTPDLITAVTRAGTNIYEYLNLSNLQQCDEIAPELPMKVLGKSAEIKSRMLKVLEEIQEVFAK